jgi:hypothetical protein
LGGFITTANPRLGTIWQDTDLCIEEHSPSSSTLDDDAPDHPVTQSCPHPCFTHVVDLMGLVSVREMACKAASRVDCGGLGTDLALLLDLVKLLACDCSGLFVGIKV